MDPGAPRGGSQCGRLGGSHGHERAQFRAALSQRDRRHAGAVSRTGARRCPRCKLEQTVVPVETIAEECGFGDAERMRRTFQRLFDVSPHDYRARFRSTLLN
ncbi:MAG: helix-turn-helix domain-containing protein [Methylocella sp.]